MKSFIYVITDAVGNSCKTGRNACKRSQKIRLEDYPY